MKDEKRKGRVIVLTPNDVYSNLVIAVTYSVIDIYMLATEYLKLLSAKGYQGVRYVNQVLL
jgi:hypothetical protein